MDLSSLIGGGTAAGGIIAAYLVYEVRVRGLLLTRIKDLEAALEKAHNETLECAQLRGRVQELQRIYPIFEDVVKKSIPAPPMPSVKRESVNEARFFGRHTVADDAERDTPSEPPPRPSAFGPFESPPAGSLPPSDTSPQTPNAKKREESDE